MSKHDETRPYEKLAFQFSCHVMHEDGSTEHREYLHSETTDPRAPLVDELVDSIGESGSVIVYNEGFERGVLKSLAETYPAAASELLGIAARLWDLMDVIRAAYQHPDYLGSNSIKNVLPVLVPDLTYKGRLIGNGGDAGAYWVEYIDGMVEPQRSEIEEELLGYCRLDTLAMVRIYEVLRDSVPGQDSQTENLDL